MTKKDHMKGHFNYKNVTVATSIKKKQNCSKIIIIIFFHLLIKLLSLSILNVIIIM